jgi:hypothetical protein
MIVFRQPLISKNQTGREMYRMINGTAQDLKGIFFNVNGKKVSADKLPLVSWFNYVKNIPYRRDPKPREIIARPKHIVNFESLGADCKKKSLLMAAWLKNNKIPFRFIASSKRPDKKIHHVFPEGKIADQWIPLDATYKTNSIGMNREDTKREVLKP